MPAAEVAVGLVAAVVVAGPVVAAGVVVVTVRVAVDVAVVVTVVVAELPQPATAKPQMATTTKKRFICRCIPQFPGPRHVPISQGPMDQTERSGHPRRSEEAEAIEAIEDLDRELPIWGRSWSWRLRSRWRSRSPRS